MRRRLLKAFTTIGLAGLVAVTLAVPAGADFSADALPSLTVTKEVVAGEHAVPVDGVFEVQVTCSKYGFSALLTYNADGSVAAAPDGWVGSGNSWTYSGLHGGFYEDEHTPSPLRHGQQCEIVEVASSATSSLAKNPEYGCEFTNAAYPNDIANWGLIEAPEPGCASVSGDGVVVQYGDPRDKSCDQSLADGDKQVLCKQSAYVTVTNTIADQPAPKPIPLPANFTG